MTQHEDTDITAATDELLAVRCLLGERGAIDELVARWHPPLWTYLRRLLGDDETAADTLQSGWLRVLRALPRLRDPARLRPWLFGIMRRTAMDQLRERYAEPVSEAIEPDALASPEPDADREAELVLMRGELAQMPVTLRDVLVLFYLKELSLTQLATTLDVPIGTVKSRLFRARRMLREQLISEDQS